MGKGYSWELNELIVHKGSHLQSEHHLDVLQSLLSEE